MVVVLLYFGDLFVIVPKEFLEHFLSNVAENHPSKARGALDGFNQIGGRDGIDHERDPIACR